MVHTSAVAGGNVLKELIIPRNDCNSFLHLGGGMSISTLNFLGSRLVLSQDMISPMNGTLVHLKLPLSLLCFRLPFLHIFSIFLLFIVVSAKLIKTCS